jgi:chemotaxis protein methyltransferase CheR
VLTPDDLDALRRLVYDHSGIWLVDSKRTFLDNQLGERLRVRGIPSAREYYHYLKYDPQGRLELERLTEALTIQETWFFREPEPVEAWRSHILPALLKRDNQKVRVWSAACSTGEEPYTLAMLFRDCGPDPALYEIWATDISTRALEVARLGVYDPYSLRHTDAAWQARYFQLTDDRRLRLSENVKQMVRLGGGNLLDPSLGVRLGGMDLIVCRNVLIYFDERSRQKVLANLFATLRPGGHLILGTVETLAHAITPFELARVGKAFLYRKPV